MQTEAETKEKDNFQESTRFLTIRDGPYGGSTVNSQKDFNE